ncbi:MAG: tRNA (adenine-N1)-methyltransferase [Deferribacterales bacterium]|nr:tRNA (adenine-N1)-methyltransferase [Deferribacterales bacterium]
MNKTIGYSLVIMSDKKENKHMITLKEGARFSTQHGFIEHDEIAKLCQGDMIKSSLGHPYRVYLPTYMDFVMNIKRQAQIIYPKDAAAMLMWGDIAPCQNVLESGVGQGALSLAILRALAGTGHLTSYEIRADFAEQAAGFIKKFMGEAPQNHTIEVRNIYEGIDGVYDRALLDLPEPWQVVKHFENALIDGGIVVAYIPTVLQVKTYVDELKACGFFSEIETAELIRRPWKVDGLSVRPEMWIYNHSAFLVTARKFRKTAQ